MAALWGVWWSMNLCVSVYVAALIKFVVLVCAPGSNLGVSVCGSLYQICGADVCVRVR